MARNEDFIYNWSNSLRKTDNGELVVATRIAASLKDKGYTSEEISDMMIADNYNMDAVDKAIETVFAAKKEEGKEVKAAYKAYVTPTCYADVKPVIEDTLQKLSAKEFVNKLIASEYPIVSKLATKKVESLYRLAERAKEDSVALEQLHDAIAPFVENAMYNAVVASEKIAPKVAISKVSSFRYVVASSVKSETDVCLETGTCNCDKYTKGNYADFGIACEHIISVTAKVSPDHKLVKGEIVD